MRRASPKAWSTPSSTARPTCSWPCWRPGSRNARRRTPGWPESLAGGGDLPAPARAPGPRRPGHARLAAAGDRVPGACRPGPGAQPPVRRRPRPHRGGVAEVLARSISTGRPRRADGPPRRLAELALALSVGTTLEQAASPDALGGPLLAAQLWPRCFGRWSGRRRRPRRRERPGHDRGDRARAARGPAGQGVRRADRAPRPSTRAARLGRRSAGRASAGSGCGSCWHTRPSIPRSTPVACAGWISAGSRSATWPGCR